MSRLFVTASGTGVGKTFVCCRVLEAVAGRVDTRAIKPVASGFDAAAPIDSDTGRLLLAQGRTPDSAGIEATTPWHYRAPLSPDMAAPREGRAVPFDDVVAWTMLDQGQDFTLIEGIGGPFVPLDERHTVADWIAAIDARVWLVVGSYLGSISHALAALRAIEARGIGVDAVILSESAEPAAPLTEVEATLARFSGGVPIVSLGRPPAPAEIGRLVGLLPLGPARLSPRAEPG